MLFLILYLLFVIISLIRSIERSSKYHIFWRMEYDFARKVGHSSSEDIERNILSRY